MRFVVFALLAFWIVPALAQIAPAPSAPMQSATTPYPAAAPSPAPAAIASAAPTIENLWRSDAALDSVGDMMKQRKYSDALPILEQIIQRNMRNADAHVLTAICWTNLGNFEKAKNALSNAFAIDKGHMGAYLVGGVIAIQEKDMTQANYYLNAIRTVCQGDLCTEYATLKKAITEAK